MSYVKAEAKAVIGVSDDQLTHSHMYIINPV